MYAYNFAYAVLILIIQKHGFMPDVIVNSRSLLIDPILHGHQFEYNLGGWFVVPLFMVEVFQVVFRHLLTKWKSITKEIFVFACYSILGVFGVNLAAQGYHEGWWLPLDRMLYFLPFFGFGYFYKAVLERRDKAPNWLYFSVILCLELVLLLHYGYIPAFTPSWCNNFITNPVVPFAVGYLGIAFWLRIAKILEPSIGKSRCINLIADNTFSIMINHFLGFTLVSLLYGYISKFTSHCQDFDWTACKTNIWYRYLPKGLFQMGIIYLIVGLIFPIIIQLGLNHFKNFWKKNLNNYRFMRKK